MDKYSVLKKYFGYDTFKYPQDKIIDEVMLGKEVIGLLPTGFGKSIIFQILAMLEEGVSIIISPLIALMEDQVLHLKEKGIPVAFIHSNVSLEEQKNIYMKLVLKKIKILYISPERLENRVFLSYVQKMKVSMLVVDEAHTILWAEGFRKAFGQIHSFIESLPIRPKLLALTATATSQTVEKIMSYLHLQNPVVIDYSIDRPNLFYRVLDTNQKLKFIIEYINLHKKARGILYCLTRRTTEYLYQSLLKLGVNCTFYHGGLSAEAKEENQKAFTEGKALVMVCTNAFGMGIDIPDIRYVMEYEIPQSLEDLVQQFGRASRDGGYGEGIVLFSFRDVETVQYFLKQQENKTIRKQNTKKLDALIDFCLTKQCRHHFISSYFQQTIGNCKVSCDNCKKKGR